MVRQARIAVRAPPARLTVGPWHWLAASSLHVAAGAAAVLGYVLVTRARGERRPPTAAIAWVLSLALLPWIAAPLFVLFGRRKALRLAASPRTAPASGPWAARLAGAFGIPGPHPAEVRFDADGATALASVHALVEGARVGLDVEMFILGGPTDPVASRLVDAMAEAAARGVRVRLLLDGLASRGTDLRALRARGIDARFFRPLLGRSDGTPRNLRNHRKLVVADGERLWSGGRNLAREYFLDAPGAPAWLDLSFCAEGALARDAARLFAHDWDGVARSVFGDPPQAGTGNAAGEGTAQWLPSGPDMPEDCAHAVLVDACYRAEVSILAVTPYFVPDDGLLQALRLAAVRDVHVQLLVPARSNHRLADIARARALRDLAAAGAHVHLLPRMVHAKAFVVDDTLGLCGSTNLDPRSLFLNHELSLMCLDARDIGWLRAWMQARIGESARFVPQPPGLLRDLGEGLVRSIAFQL